MPSSTNTVTINPRDYGAIGIGNQNNSAADTSGLIAALNAWLQAEEGSTLDLCGGEYFLDYGLAPSVQLLGIYERKRMTNGTLRVSTRWAPGTGNSNTGVIIDLSSLPGNLQETSFDNLNLVGFTTASQKPLAAGGIKFSSPRNTRVSDCNILLFTGAGIQETSGATGLEFRVSRCNIVGNYSTSPVVTNVGIDIAAYDCAITDCSVADCGTPVLFRQKSNFISGCHVYQYSLAGNSTNGIVCNNASQMTIVDNYIDTCRVVLQDQSKTGAFLTNTITGNRFYAPYSFNPGSGWGFIDIMPFTSGATVNSMTVHGNQFRTENYLVRAIAIDNSIGTINGGNTQNVYVNGNGFVGVTPAFSHPYALINVNNTTNGSVDFSSLIPFGSVQRLRGASARGKAAQSAWHFDFGSNNVVTAYFASNWTGQINVQASINNQDVDGV